MIGRAVMRNRILLIRPPTVMKGAAFIATQFPMNLASMAAVLLAKGYNVNIWDYDVEDYDEDSFGKRLKAFSPFIVGISCYTPTIINGHMIAAVVKKYLPESKIVVGGPHVSALPAETLNEFSSFDIGVVGEGEETMVELADKLSGLRPLDGTPGIIYRDGNITREFGR